MIFACPVRSFISIASATSVVDFKDSFSIELTAAVAEPEPLFSPVMTTFFLFRSLSRRLSLDIGALHDQLQFGVIFVLLSTQQGT